MLFTKLACVNQHDNSSFITDRYDTHNIYEEARSGHVTCNVWGWISMHGMGDVTRIQGRFTAATYIDILENFFLPSLHAKNFPFPPGPIIFVQDRCPVHTARAVREWFSGQNNVQLLELPSKGCDCNPIEHIWANMVNNWEDELERTGEQLMAHTQRQWELFRAKPQEIRNLVSSVPDRLRAVIDADGGWTR